LAAAAVSDLFGNLVVHQLMMLKSFKIFDNFRTLIRKRPKLLNSFDLARN